jgi:hypothetical protein
MSSGQVTHYCDTSASPDASAAGFFDTVGDIARVVVLIEVRDKNVSALAGERDRDGAATIAVAAADNRPSTREFYRTAITLSHNQERGFIRACTPGAFVAATKPIVFPLRVIQFSLII